MSVNRVECSAHAIGQKPQALFPHPAIMGVLNCSENSFFAATADLDSALFRAEGMVRAGVDIIDVGGEATNPAIDLSGDNTDVSAEIDRILPVIEAIRQRFEVALSVDTSAPEVMQAALSAGVTLINDQRALSRPGAFELVASQQPAVCLMHFADRQPGSSTPAALLQQIQADLLPVAQRLEQAGLSPQQIYLDPGFGQGHYGKNTAENFYLLAHLGEWLPYGYPLLVGWSRKSMLGEVLGGAPVEKRLHASVAAALSAVERGAAMVRVHDVQATHDALQVWNAIQRYKMLG